MREVHGEGGGGEGGGGGGGGREKSCLKSKCLMKSNHPRPILVPRLSFSSCHLQYGKVRDTAGARKQNGDLGMRLNPQEHRKWTPVTN